MINITHLTHGGSAVNSPDTIVVHSMAEYVTGGGYHDHAVKFLDKVGLSAHAIVAPDGTIYRCREDEERAWHAKGYNKNTLGIEFLVAGEHSFPDFIQRIKTEYLLPEQYQAGLAQIRQWCDKWPIKHIVRHSDIDPDRKRDPGDGFPWQQLLLDIGL